MSVRLFFGAVMLNLLVMLNLSLAACQKQEVSVHEPTEARLRERITAANNSFLSGRFDDFVNMRSARERKALFESDEDKKKGFHEWKLFLEREKPTMELLEVELHEHKAIAKMKGGVQRKDGTRSESVMYDLWTFENGDWFLDTAGRTSPEDFPP